MKQTINPSHIHLIKCECMRSFNIGTVRFRKRGSIARMVAVYLLKESGLSASEIVGFGFTATERVVYSSIATVSARLQTSAIFRLRVERLIRTILNKKPEPNFPVLENLEDIRLPSPLLLKHKVIF